MTALTNFATNAQLLAYELFLFGAPANGSVTDPNADSSWNVFDMFNSMRGDGEAIVGYLAGFLAVILFGFAAIKFAQAVMSQQGRGANVGVAIAALVVGGFLGFDAYSRIAGLSQGAGETIENWGTGTQNAK